MRDPEALRQGAIRLLTLALRVGEKDSELSELLVACAMRQQDEATALEEGPGVTLHHPTSKLHQLNAQEQEQIQPQTKKGFVYAFSFPLNGFFANKLSSLTSLMTRQQNKKPSKLLPT